MYGGKIDHEGDFEQLRQIVENVMQPGAYEDDHVLSLSDVPDVRLNVPSGTGPKDFMNWIANLPEREPPTYLGLPANAEKLLLVGHSQNVIRDLARLTELLEEGEQDVSSEDGEE